MVVKWENVVIAKGLVVVGHRRVVGRGDGGCGVPRVSDTNSSSSSRRLVVVVVLVMVGSVCQ